MSTALVSIPQTRYSAAPSAHQPVRSSTSCTFAAGCGAIANSIANIPAIATGMPRLPQAIARKARKVLGSSSSPSSIGCGRSSCTARNNGTPSSGAATMCANLPRRARTPSVTSTMVTPTAALAAAVTPQPAPIAAVISSMPTATEAPLSTCALSSSRHSGRRRAAAAAVQARGGGAWFMEPECRAPGAAAALPGVIQRRDSAA
ncbi:MAG: hypothetical protein U1E95_02010 [Rubrivivax sp.]